MSWEKFSIIWSHPLYSIPFWIVLSILFYFLVRIGVSRTLARTVDNDPLRFRLQRGSRFVINTVLLVALFEIVAGDRWSTASFLGLLSAGLAFVFREPLLNLAGWTYILSRSPFRLGDRVQIDQGPAGDVIDIGLHDFSLLEIGNWVDADQSTGRVLHIPNSVVFSKGIANYQQGFPFLWHELKVEITFDSDWKKAMAIIQDVAETEMSTIVAQQSEILQKLKKQEEYLIRYKHLGPIVYFTKSPYALVLTLRFCCSPRARRSTESDLWQKLLDRLLKEPDILLAYPTYEIARRSDSVEPGELAIPRSVMIQADENQVTR